MKAPILSLLPDRRSLLKGAAAMGALQVASPFVIPVRAADNIKMGMVDPLTGVYAAPAGNEVMGAKLAVDQINAKGGSSVVRSSCLWRFSERRRHRCSKSAQTNRTR